MDRLDRVKRLLGEDFNKLHEVKILLLGVGGVGGFCLDALYRSGITNITAVDFDRFEITNQNRQIGSENIGELKTDVFQKLYPSITTICQKIDPIWVQNQDFNKYDLVIDVIDDLEAKVALALHVKTPFISSMGGARKLDPTKIAITSVWKTKGDGLARKFRSMLRKANFDGDFDVVYSDEEPKCQDLGSFVGVTGSFGLALSSLALRRLLGRIEKIL